MSNTQLPTLPYNEWKDTKMTLHLILQIIGKVRLKMTPRKNHWWFITEYVSSKGFTTSSIPYNNGHSSFEVTFNVHKGQVEILSSEGQENIITLKDGMSIAEFYGIFMEQLKSIGIEPDILAKPFDLGIDKPFAELSEYHKLDLDYIHKFWQIMLWVDGVMNEFSGRYYGKTCPVQIYWHHLDIAVTRFSGRKAPALPAEARTSDKDAYSHEVISFGFWAGDEQVQEPAFYSYTHPSPEGLDKEPLQPAEASWVDNNGSPMAFYRYEDLLKEEAPREALLNFFETAYQAGAKLANWEVDHNMIIPLEDL